MSGSSTGSRSGRITDTSSHYTMLSPLQKPEDTEVEEDRGREGEGGKKGGRKRRKEGGEREGVASSRHERRTQTPCSGAPGIQEEGELGRGSISKQGVVGNNTARDHVSTTGKGERMKTDEAWGDKDQQKPSLSPFAPWVKRFRYGEE